MDEASEETALQKWLSRERQTIENDLNSTAASLREASEALDLYNKRLMQQDETQAPHTNPWATYTEHEDYLAHTEAYQKSLSEYDEIAAGEHHCLQFNYEAIEAHLTSFATRSEKLKYLDWLKLMLNVEGLERYPGQRRQFFLLNEIMPDYSAIVDRAKMTCLKNIDALIEFHTEHRESGKQPDQSTTSRLHVTGRLNEFVAIMEAMIIAGIIERPKPEKNLVAHFSYNKEGAGVYDLPYESYRAAAQQVRKSEQRNTGKKLLLFVKTLLRSAYRGYQSSLDEIQREISRLYGEK